MAGGVGTGGCQAPGPLGGGERARVSGVEARRGAAPGAVLRPPHAPGAASHVLLLSAASRAASWPLHAAG